MYRTYLIMLIGYPILYLTCVQVPLTKHAFLIPRTAVNITTLFNVTCDQCVCMALGRQSATVNCFLINSTCQLFDRVPNRYRLQFDPQAGVYFTGGSLPNASQCCMPDLDSLLARLYNATMISATQPGPRSLTVDNHGYIVTVQVGTTNISRFDPLNLVLIDVTPVSTQPLRSITYQQNAYYAGTDANTVEVVDSNTLSAITAIIYSGIDSVRDIMFLHDGQTMVVSSTYNQLILFFDRSNGSFMYQISTSYATPHGLRRVNDSFFYATSWDWNSVYSYTTMDGVTWNETLFVDMRTVVNQTGGAHLTVDECGRRWVSRGDSAVLIYDRGGSLLGNFSIEWSSIFDVLFANNYVMYLSDLGGRVIRLDPHIEC